MAFYDLSEQDRVSLTLRAISEKRTVIERWDALASTEAEPWSARADAAAKMLGAAPSVADLGCGTMTLERYLAPGTQYLPVDVVQRDDRTVICDFNASPPPKLPALACACLGILEYILEPTPFMLSLAESYRTCVISYNVHDGGDTLPRRAHAWVNDFGRTDIESFWTATGWTPLSSQEVSYNQFVWLLRSSL